MGYPEGAKEAYQTQESGGRESMFSGGNDASKTQGEISLFFSHGSYNEVLSKHMK